MSNTVGSVDGTDGAVAVVVDVVGGAAATNRKSNDEEGTLNLQGCEPSCRLSCVTFVYGDVEVRVRPDRDGGFFGSATSGSAW